MSLMLKWLSSKYFDNIFNGCQSVQMFKWADERIRNQVWECEWDGEMK